jgi:hypothetical protein
MASQCVKLPECLPIYYSHGPLLSTGFCVRAPYHDRASHKGLTEVAPHSAAIPFENAERTHQGRRNLGATGRFGQKARYEGRAMTLLRVGNVRVHYRLVG